MPHAKLGAYEHDAGTLYPVRPAKQKNDVSGLLRDSSVVFRKRHERDMVVTEQHEVTVLWIMHECELVECRS